jgi:outer membrane receptor protein involved in Fe transport
LVGLSASYDLPSVAGLDRLRLQLNIDNLLDKEFINSVTGSTSSLPEFGVIGGLSAESALDRYFIGFPRTVTLSVSAEV